MCYVIDQNQELPSWFRVCLCDTPPSPALSLYLCLSSSMLTMCVCVCVNTFVKMNMTDELHNHSLSLNDAILIYHDVTRGNHGNTLKILV